MSLSDAASIATIVGSLVTFFSLILLIVSFIFLARQIRQANTNQKAIVLQNRVSRLIDSSFHIIDPAMLPTWLKGQEGDADIGADGYYRFLTMARAGFWSMEDTFSQHRSGLMDDGIYNAHIQTLRRVMHAPGMRAAWKSVRDTYDPEFASYVDSVCLESIQSPELGNFEQWLKLVQEEKSAQTPK